jgi:hypothetical protein
MVSIPKVVGVMSCGFLLCLGLYLNGNHTIKGEVLRVEPSSYFVKQYDGNQVSVHIVQPPRWPDALAKEIVLRRR